MTNNPVHPLKTMMIPIENLRSGLVLTASLFLVLASLGVEQIQCGHYSSLESAEPCRDRPDLVRAKKINPDALVPSPSPRPGCDANPLFCIGPAKTCGQFKMNKLRSTFGEESPYGFWPASVTVMSFQKVNFGKTIFCRGALISKKHILTTATCMSYYDERAKKFMKANPQQVAVKVNEHDRTNFNGQNGTADFFDMAVETICMNEKSNWQTGRKPVNDLAVLTLKDPLDFEHTNIFHACLPRNPDQIDIVGPKSKCYFVGSGFGYNKKEGAYAQPFIRHIKVERIHCGTEVDPSMVCLAAKGHPHDDICEEDFGGPVFCVDENKRWAVVSLASYGPGCVRSNKAWKPEVTKFVNVGEQIGEILRCMKET